MSAHFKPPGRVYIPRARGLIGVRAEAPTNSEVKALMDRLLKAHEDFKAENDDLRKTVAALKSDPTQSEKVDKINAAMDRIQKDIDALNLKIASAQIGSGDEGAGRPVTAEQRAYRQTWSSWFRGRATDEQVRAAFAAMRPQAGMHRESDPDGGYLVPEETSREIERIIGLQSIMRQIATVRRISTGSFKKLVQTQGAASGWVGEREARPETGTPKLIEQAFEVMELYANPSATQLLLDDAEIDIGAWLGEEISVSFDEQEGSAFINGDGNRKPRGLLSYTTVASGSWSYGSVEHVVSGGAAGFAATDPADRLIDLSVSLKSAYLNGAIWLMNRRTLAEIRKFKDGDGNYIWIPGMTAGSAGTLFGYPVRTDDNMPNIGANAYPIAFGDFRRAYIILDRVGIRVLRDPFTNKPYVMFYTTKRVGGGVNNFDAYKLLKIAA